VQKYSPKFHRTIKLAPAIGDWTTVHQREDVDAIEIHPIRTSNFDSLTRAQLRFLHYLHYRLAERLCVKFSTDMDIKVELHTVLATQMSYQEFLENAKDKVVQADVVLSAGHKINLIFDWDLADMMINRLVGGAGSVGHSEVFTSIETSILKAQIEALLPEITNAWHMTLPSDSVIDFAVGQYRRNPKISSREAYVQFGFYLVFGQQELRKFVIAYPNTLLRGLVQHWQKNKPKKQKQVYFSEKTLQTLNVDVCVSLGAASLTMSELRQLRVGDVVVLDTLTDQPLPIQLGPDSGPWLGYPGVSQNHKLALQLQRSGAPVATLEKNVVAVPEQKEPPRQPIEVPAFVRAGDAVSSHVAPPKPSPVVAPVAVAGAMVGAAAAAVSMAPQSVDDSDDFDVLDEEGQDVSSDVQGTVVEDDEFDIEDDLDYEEDHEVAHAETSDEAFDFSEDKDEDDAHEEVHGDADDSEFSWDDLDDEL
jgi:flagellar motor switch protein FliM